MENAQDTAAIDPHKEIRDLILHMTTSRALRWLPAPLIWLAFAGVTLWSPAIQARLDARPVGLPFLCLLLLLAVLPLMTTLRQIDVSGMLIGAPLVPRWIRPLGMLSCVPIPHLPWALVLMCSLDGNQPNSITSLFAAISAAFHAWRVGYLRIPGEWAIVTAALIIAGLAEMGANLRISGPTILAFASFIYLAQAHRANHKEIA